MSSKRTFYRIFSTSFDKRKLILGKRGGVETEYGYFSRRKGAQEETWERHLSCRPRSCRCKGPVNRRAQSAARGLPAFSKICRGCRTLVSAAAPAKYYKAIVNRFSSFSYRNFPSFMIACTSFSEISLPLFRGSYSSPRRVMRRAGRSRVIPEPCSAAAPTMV